MHRILLLIAILMPIISCSPDKPEMVKVGTIQDNEYEPSEWGRIYPLEYESWLKTKEMRTPGLSKYKKGWDTDNIIWDKLSEFPYMAILFNGMGFGIEYNEPRGHYYMRKDQDEIDQSRTKAGGVCLNCKSPYMDSLTKIYGKDFYSMPWKDAISKIPVKHKDLGASCMDCHDNKTMDLKTNRIAFQEGIAKLSKKDFSRQEKRILVCAQCHVTYNIPKNDKGQSIGLVHPWDESSWGNISIENIIKQIKNNPSYLEWKQTVTGFKLGFIRHPEFELFTKQSVHFNAGLACADCHMPYKRVGSSKISDHNLMSPIKDNLKACVTCHPKSEERLKNQVLEIQNCVVSLLNRAGYATATVAKLFETANKQIEQGKKIDMAFYDSAKDFYLEAFYRAIYIGAENSVGFHNSSESSRILGDSIAFASKAESLLRQALTKASIDIPKDLPLELSKYLKERGTKKLNFKPEQEVKDPYKNQEKLIPDDIKGIQ
ncbi:MAG: ammonia-forming cytochrome c nitrite reductase subunit c552 [Desulfobacterales bacterium]|nr:ammonia-forming cytochrome c nitrite reductase subunit c552 [Desulfobacterales bacterium]